VDRFVGDDAGLAGIDSEGVLFRAALLAHCGRRARALAARLASVCDPGGGRSCVEAGVPLQLMVDAPGDVALRVALRLGASLRPGALTGLMADARAGELADLLAPLPPPDHPSLGFWLFWSDQRQRLFADLRDPEPARAIERLRRVLDGGEERRLASILARLCEGRPWGFTVEVEETGRRSVRLYWLASRPAWASRLVETLAPGRWREVVETLAYLLKRPGESGRWMLAIPLDSDAGGITVGSSAWALVPEDESKHRAVGRAIAALGGPRDYAEALWSFCRGGARPGWRVGRTCEIGLGEGPRLRLFFTPQLQLAATAGISSSGPGDSSAGPTEADPLSA
jgi:hypothetical protein